MVDSALETYYHDYLFTCLGATNETAKFTLKTCVQSYY